MGRARDGLPSHSVGTGLPEAMVRSELVGVAGLGSEAPGTPVLVSPHGAASGEVGRSARWESSGRVAPTSPSDYKEVKTD